MRLHLSDDMNVVGRPLPACGDSFLGECRKSRVPSVVRDAGNLTPNPFLEGRGTIAGGTSEMDYFCRGNRELLTLAFACWVG